jgi:hypothetical protein
VVWLAQALALSLSRCVPLETQPPIALRVAVALPLPEKELLLDVIRVSLPLPLGIHWLPDRLPPVV